MSIELVMIVKNAETVLSDTLKTVLPFVKECTILDTGSTDSTINIIKSFNTIRLFEEKFVDFSTSRNRAIELSTQKCDYTLVLDDSFNILHPEMLCKIIKSNKDMYYISVNTVHDHYYSNRLFRTSKQYKYKYKIHEFIASNKSDTISFIDRNVLSIKDVKDDNAKKRTSERLHCDVQWLEQDLKEEKTTRIYYYLSITHNVMGDMDKAEQYLHNLIAMGMTDDFTYMAYNQLATMYTNKGEEWQSVYNCYNNMMRLDSKRADPYYYIGLYYYNNMEYEKSLVYIKYAYTLDTPISVTPINVSIYTKTIPYLYGELLLKTGNKKKGIEILKGLDTIEAKKTLEYYNSSHSSDTIKVKKSNRRILVIHTGNPNIGIWDPKKVYINASGSEIMAINLAVYLTSIGWGVYIFGNIMDHTYDYQCIIDNVTFKSNEYYDNFMKMYYIDVLLVSRYTDYTVYYPNINSVYLWVHDTDIAGTSLQTHPTKFKGLICVSDWHARLIKQLYNFPNHYMHTIENAIDMTTFSTATKILYRFIYTSCSTRGLDTLLEMFPKVVEKYPSATLHIFIKNKSEYNSYESKNVLLYDRVDQKTLHKEICKSDVWLYPTHFKETFCITALEMQAGRVLCVSTKLAALETTIGSRGVLVDGNITNKEVQQQMLEKMFFVLDNPKIKAHLIEQGYKWACQHTITNIGSAFDVLFSKNMCC